ncbi:hypothetical protein [Oceaniglobus ichthyenteri]|uniref:hypothetical protein n=1 Tax=Oceaniglobus ichthyenteri TaxID=2136177 RepID=UPI000D39D293|nr:hypothetical protein [Oceaniglobus ichthyenteri]
MNEWGIPDWRDPDAYGDFCDWSRNRWKWEFLRRREDLRQEFKEYASQTYQSNLKFREWLDAEHPTHEGGRILRPEDPGFIIFSRILWWEMPNPKIGDQPENAIGWSWTDTSIREFTRETAPAGFLRVDFDLSAPIAPQIENVKKRLVEVQTEESGGKVQKRRHPAKWPEYLRVLDAAEGGASLSEIAKFLKYKAQTEQGARDTLRAAKELRFNF